MYIVPHLTAQRAETVRRRAVLTLLGLCFVAGHAGGLGLVPLLVLMGLFGVFTTPIETLKTELREAVESQWEWALALFVGWALLSSLWSPYEKASINALKLVFGLIFFEVGRRAFITAAGTCFVKPTNRFQSLMMVLPVIAAILLCLDIISGFGLSFAVDPPQAGEDLERRRADAIMNTANGLVFLILMSSPSIILLLWTRYRGPIIAVLLLALLIVTAALSGLNVGIAALILSVCAMLSAAFYPRATLNTLTASAMALIAFAPILAAFAMWSSSAFRASLPFSWEHRLVTWSYVGEKIREHPIMGHGFDASRTFDGTFSARGFDNLPVVSLHPHNAGLQIWLETGVIGAIFAATVLWTLGQAATRFAQGGRARAMVCAGLITPIILIASVSYGVWQEWWWATLFISAGVLHLVPRTKKTPTA